MIVLAIGSDPWEIYELDQNAAIAGGDKSCGIAESGHWLTS
jgi:hypothetical protein